MHRHLAVFLASLTLQISMEKAGFLFLQERLRHTHYFPHDLSILKVQAQLSGLQATHYFIDVSPVPTSLMFLFLFLSLDF